MASRPDPHLDEHEPITTKLREPKSQETYGDLIRRMSEHRDLIDISYTSQRAQDFLDEAALQSMTVDAVEYAQSHGAKAGIARLKERIEQNEQRQARSSRSSPTPETCSRRSCRHENGWLTALS